MSGILIKNALLFDGEAVASGVDVGIADARVVFVSGHSGSSERTSPEVPGMGAATLSDPQVIDAAGRLVTAGLVNAHTHIYSALACGIGLKEDPPENFTQILERLWWRLDRALTLHDIALSTRLHALDCLRAGVTSVFDHHASQVNVEGSLHAIADELETIGVRGCLCYEVSDREGPEIARAGLRESASILKRAADTRGNHLRAMVGLHASMTLSDETLAAAREIAEPHAAGFHVHVAEDAADQVDAQHRYGLRVLERLANAGILGSETLCVHGVHLDEIELDILANSQSLLIHCPQSNMNNAVGAVHLQRLHDAGIRLALGTDGFAAHLWREALCAHLLQNHLSGDPREGYAVVPTLMAANQRLASETFGVPLGAIGPGAQADLVVWDYVPATPLSNRNLWGHVLFGLVGARAAEVLIDGRVVMSSGSPTTIDEERLRIECRRTAEALWKRF